MPYTQILDLNAFLYVCFNLFAVLFPESGKNGLFEGDIDLTDHDRVDMSSFGDIDGPIKTNVKRNAQRTRQGLWITRVVPYEIDGNAITGKAGLEGGWVGSL